MMHSETETIEVSHFSSAEEVEQELEAKVGALMEQAAASAGVVEARTRREAAESKREQLKSARRDLAERAKALLEENNRSALRLDEALITGERLTAAQLDNHGRLEGEHRAAMRASERLVERLFPMAEIEVLEGYSQEYFAHAREARRVADERIQVTARLLAQAAEHEGEIAFDPRNTVSGMLVAEAEALEQKGRDHLKWATERRDQHAEMMAKW